jgi:hypothetical protein
MDPRKEKVEGADTVLCVPHAPSTRARPRRIEGKEDDDRDALLIVIGC